jgi:colanic acid/amylovoran biosynthesis glycosyltransferase
VQSTLESRKRAVFGAVAVGKRTVAALNRSVLAYIFERFPKFSQTFCYREIFELFRQGERPVIFSLRGPDLGPEKSWDSKIIGAVHRLPEGDEFAEAVDAVVRTSPRSARKVLREWRGKRDSLRLNQAVYIGVRLRELRVRHVHAHFAGMAARTAFWIRKFFGLSYSVTVHANDIFAPNDFEIGLDQILSCAGAIIVVSDFGADYIRRKFPETAGHVHRIYNGVDLKEFQPARFEQPPLILSIGRLISKKGFDLLIAACGILRERGTEFRCEIIGEGPLEEELQRQIREHNLVERVRLVGPKRQAEIATRLSDATVFSLPCRVDPDGAMDNLPTVIMEAMAAALPVVSTDVGGVREMVIDGKTGSLVSTENPTAIADAISRFISDADLVRSFGQAARERAAEVFSVQDNVCALRSVLASCSN